MALYIGTNYHPHDHEKWEWERDIALMKEAGFTTVRLGHLCWDSYEPEEGIYTFEWFDQVMDMFADARIGVLLDVSMRPAPVWVHQLCPGCGIYNKAGVAQESLTRYMEDVGDPGYQMYALRFAEILVKRYGKHPALQAFGLCNELGAGFISYSPYARARFQNWLKDKYGSIERLNKAWQAQRWSRKYRSFQEIPLQENGLTVGPPEGWLDMRRFFSDETGVFITRLKNVVEKAAPQIPHSSNHYAEKDNYGFDYLKYSEGFVDYPGMGMYPEYESGNSLKLKKLMYIYMQRIAESGKPMWCLEFQTGSKGVMAGPFGMNRMHALLALMYRAQMVLGWTWRSMAGGEEQYLYGMLGHDGYPTDNYKEYQWIARDFKILEQYGFPYLPEPEIAIAYQYDNMLVSQYSPLQYRQRYEDGIMSAMEYFDGRNVDYNVVDLRNLKGKYKLLVIAGHVVMDGESAGNIRKFLNEGGNVLMTGYSASVDENGSVFKTPKPGNLTDVFGIRVAGFSRGEYYKERLELNSGKVWIADEETGACLMSHNDYGKGKAYYLARDLSAEVMEQIMGGIEKECALSKGLQTPKGIRGRKIREGQYFYVNLTEEELLLPLNESCYGVLGGKNYEKEALLKPLDAELFVSGVQADRFTYGKVGE